jgi:hypothetical protein
MHFSFFQPLLSFIAASLVVEISSILEYGIQTFEASSSKRRSWNGPEPRTTANMSQITVVSSDEKPHFDARFLTRAPHWHTDSSCLFVA